MEALKGPPAAAHRADPQVAKPGDEPSLIDFHAAAQALVRRFAAQLKGDVGAAAAVAGQRVTDRPAAERVAVHQDDVVAIGQEVAQIDDGSQGSQQLRLDGEAQLDSPFRRFRLQSIPDGPRQVVQVDCRLAAGAVEDVDRTHRDRAAGHGQQWLRHLLRQRPQPFAAPGAEHERPNPRTRPSAAHCLSRGKTMSLGRSGRSLR